jgi:lysophospholipase L1-like esterase
MEKKQNGVKMIIGAGLLLLMILSGTLLFTKKEIQKYENLSCAERTTYNNSAVEICIPDIVYVASGQDLTIYNKQITNLGEHISEYEVEWISDYGGVQAHAEQFSISTLTGMEDEFSVSVAVYGEEHLLLAKKEFTLKIVEAKQWQFSVLAIGDSLSANGALYTRLQEHLGNQLICNGTRGYEGFLTEARLGFSAENYLTETGYYLEEGEDVHKFWNPETQRFDWNYYKTSTGFNPDVVLLHLGTNGLLSGDENAENICKIVELIRQDDENIPIYVVNTIYQSDQNGIGSMKLNNGSLMFPGQYKQERDLANFNLRVYLTEKLAEKEKVYLVPAAISVDSEHVFNMEEKTVNPYSEVTEKVATDAVHPAAEGYYQIADAIYNTMCGTMEDW